MSLDDFVKSKGKHAKQPATQKNSHGQPEEAGKIDIDAESPPMPDRVKIALLKRLLEEKNMAPGPAQQRLSLPKPAATTRPKEDFLPALERFADWIRGRTYLRGDVETAKQMLANLVLLDRSLLPLSEGVKTIQKFADIAEFLKEAKQHDSLHPDTPILTKQELAVLIKRKQGKPLTSTDYRHLKLLKDRVKATLKVVPFHEFLADYLDVPDY
ncbi:MAG: hypothetical protein GYA24_12025 [Candidatus Lokiarchaeota archaeon]|nr:hypothetical protein [Candidatus Lokiarchaeota archaeon]